MSIDPRIADIIIESLRAGEVPREGLEHFATGIDAHVAALEEELARIADQRGRYRFLRGEYGAGYADALAAESRRMLGGLGTSVSNLSVKIKSTGPAARETALRVQEALAGGELPPLDEWAEFETTKRTAILSGFQECLPAAAEQAFLRDTLLDLEGAKAWAREIESR